MAKVKEHNKRICDKFQKKLATHSFARLVIIVCDLHYFIHLIGCAV